MSSGGYRGHTTDRRGSGRRSAAPCRSSALGRCSEQSRARRCPPGESISNLGLTHHTSMYSLGPVINSWAGGGGYKKVGGKPNCSLTKKKRGRGIGRKRCSHAEGGGGGHKTF